MISLNLLFIYFKWIFSAGTIIVYCMLWVQKGLFTANKQGNIQGNYTTTNRAFHHINVHPYTFDQLFRVEFYANRRSWLILQWGFAPIEWTLTNWIRVYYLLWYIRLNSTLFLCLWKGISKMLELNSIRTRILLYTVIPGKILRCLTKNRKIWKD